MEWIDKMYEKERKWKDVFLQDIKYLETVGIHHKDFEKVRQLVVRITNREFYLTLNTGIIRYKNNKK